MKSEEMDVSNISLSKEDYTEYKKIRFENLKKAVKEFKEVKAGKKKTKPLAEFLNAL